MKKTEILQYIKLTDLHNHEKEEYKLQNIEFEKLLLKVIDLNDVIDRQKIYEKEEDEKELQKIENENLLLEINSLNDSIKDHKINFKKLEKLLTSEGDTRRGLEKSVEVYSISICVYVCMYLLI